MSNRFYGEIQIAGDISSSQAAEDLISAIENCDPEVINDLNIRVMSGSIVEQVLDCIQNNKCLELHDRHALSGCFEEVEACCREYGLAYVRYSDTDYGFEREAFDPNVNNGKLSVVDVDTYKNPIVRVSDIEKIIQNSIEDNEIVKKLNRFIQEKGFQINFTGRHMQANEEAIDFLINELNYEHGLHPVS